MIILILVTIVTTVFLERIWSSSQTVQGIESSNAAYYQSVGIIEEQLMEPGVSKRSPWAIQNKNDNYSYTWRHLEAQTGSAIMPIPGYGNSPYDDDYNIISLGEPLQIVIPNWLTWSNVFFEFRIPQIAESWTGIDNAMDGSGIILWTIGYSGATLYASGETQIFKWIYVNTSTNQFSSFSWTTNTGSSLSIDAFYTQADYLGTAGSKCTGYNCTLKLSMIRPVKTSWTYPRWVADGRSLPFLEYKITFNIPVPSQFMTLEATAYSYGFQRTKTVRIPQITTNTALDFAVLQ